MLCVGFDWIEWDRDAHIRFTTPQPHPKTTNTNVRSFNPSSKVAPGYQDILGGAGDDDVEVIAGVMAEADVGFDEIPDGADEGFGAAEFGEEDYVRVRDGEEQLRWLERSAPEIDPVLREMEGLGGEDGEGDEGLYGESSSSSDDEEEGEKVEEWAGRGGRGGGGLFGIGASAAGAGAAGGGGGPAFDQGFAALERAGAAGGGSESDYEGDDDDSDEE